MTEIAVVGGGAVGLTATLELADSGAAVTLFEREEPGSGATGRSAGICYDAYVDPRDAACAARSLDRFRELGVLGERPYLWFARDGEAAGAIESHVDGMQAAGRDVSPLEPAAVNERFPALATADLTAAAVAENAGVVDTDRYVEAITARARRAGVTIRTGTPATVRSPRRIEAGDDSLSVDAVLVAAGAWTNQVLDDVGVDLAVGTYRTQLLQAALSGRGVGDGLPMVYDASGEWYARPTTGGVLAGDGSAMYHGPPGAYGREADEPFRRELLETLGERIDRTVEPTGSWAGLCTATPDGDPLVGECLPDLYVATGFCGHGFMRSPAVGEAVAEAMVGDGGVDAFDPTRFDGTEPIGLPGGVAE